MNTIELEVKESSSSGAQHVEVKIDGKNAGILYITDDERLDILKLLKRGSIGEDIEIINTNLEDEEDLEEDID